MAKKPTKLSLHRRIIDRVWVIFKANPITTGATLVAIFGGIPSAVVGLNYIEDHSEPLWIAQHYWVRDHTAEQLKPLQQVTQNHSDDLDYLILKEQRKALSEAKDDLKRDPASTSAPAVINRLQRSIDVRQKRLDDSMKAK